MSLNYNLQRVRTGKMSYVDFLKSAGEYNDFKKWCDSHNVDLNEDNAEFYFDQTFNSDYDPEEVLMEM